MKNKGYTLGFDLTLILGSLFIMLISPLLYIWMKLSKEGKVTWKEKIEWTVIGFVVGLLIVFVFNIKFI